MELKKEKGLWKFGEGGEGKTHVVGVKTVLGSKKTREGKLERGGKGGGGDEGGKGGGGMKGDLQPREV